MKTKLTLLAALAAFGFSSCASNAYDPNAHAKRTATNGALMGAAAGAIIGKQSGETGKGAALGAAAGGAAGYMYGQNQQQYYGR
ncbi:MAG: glycine zipper domain-containing protein [Verrucomicrobiaceae bacterium]